jgi:hypothetical protein
MTTLQISDMATLRSPGAGWVVLSMGLIVGLPE